MVRDDNNHVAGKILITSFKNIITHLNMTTGYEKMGENKFERELINIHRLVRYKLAGMSDDRMLREKSSLGMGLDVLFHFITGKFHT